MADKIYRYWIMVPSGLEEVALDELRDRVPHLQGVKVEKGGRLGQIFFTFERSPIQLAGLRSAVQLAGLVGEIHRVTVGRPGLENICSRVARFDLAAVVSLARTQAPEIDTGAFTLSATLQGRYRFSTSELVRAVAGVLREKHGLREGQGSRLLRFHLQVTGRRALLGLRLGEGVSPNAAVAFCLARLLAIQPGARVLWTRRDRSELVALHSFFAPGLLVGVAPARINNGNKKAPPSLVATRDQLPLKGDFFDYVLGYAAEDYAAELAELARILRFGGVAIIQVARIDRFINVLEAEDYPFVVLANLDFQEHGRRYGLLILERLEEYDPGLIQVAWDV